MKPVTARIGGYITTWSGIQMFPLDPREEEICIEDIAHSLSLQCRWGGHIPRHWAVASHSLEVMKILVHLGREDLSLMGLLHDSSEAYLVDLPRPIKRSIGFGEGYIAAEDKLLAAIFRKFKVNNDVGLHPMIKLADNMALAAEKRDFGIGGDWGSMPVEPWGGKVVLTTPKQAERAFLSAFKRLTTPLAK